METLEHLRYLHNNSKKIKQEIIATLDKSQVCQCEVLYFLEDHHAIVKCLNKNDDADVYCAVVVTGNGNWIHCGSLPTIEEAILYALKCLQSTEED
jgi:hypothetical protein